jgi:multiple sugar transport system ATP-binding protein
MNLFDATLRDEGDAGLSVSFGGFELPVPAEVLDARPALRAYVDRTIVLGVRPEDMEDATLVTDAPAERRISSTVELREALGSDVVVHLSIAAPPAMTDDMKELASDVGLEALEQVQQQAAGGHTTLLARLNPRSIAAKGDPIELVVDTHRLHFFDPDDGSGIYATPSGRGA